MKKSKCISGLKSIAAIAVLLFGCMIIGDSSFVSQAEDTENVELDEDGFVYGDFRYGEGSRGAYITAYKGTDTVVTIPAAIGDLPVIEIYSEAFKDNTTLTSVSFPPCLDEIGKNAFDGCSSLETVEFRNADDNVTEAEKLVFYEYAFANCGNLREIEFPEYTTEIGDYAFVSCGFDEAVALPESLKELGQYAFSKCTDLTQIDILGNLRGVSHGKYAFSGCTSLRTMELGKGVTCVAEGMFKDCDKLNSIHLANTILTIDESAFENCSEIKDIDIPVSVDYIEKAAFKNCDGLEEITLPDSVTWVRDSAFEGCDNLVTVNWSRNLKSIGSSAFKDCVKLDTVNLPDSLESVWHYAFSGCTALVRIYIPRDIKDLGEDVLKGTTTKIYTTEGTRYSYVVSYAESNGFDIEYEDAAAKPLVYDEKWEYAINEDNETVTLLKYIGESDPSSTLIIPSELEVQTALSEGDNDGMALMKYKVTALGDYVFLDNDDIIKYVVPDTVKSIGTGAFCNTAAQKICIHSSVKTIGEAAFERIYLPTIYTEATAGEVIAYAHKGDIPYIIGIEKIIVPEKVTVSMTDGSIDVPVTIEPSSATDELAWDAGTSDNDEIADTNIDSGNKVSIRANGVGTTKITLTYHNMLNDEDVTAVCTVTVTEEQSGVPDPVVPTTPEDVSKDNTKKEEKTTEQPGIQPSTESTTTEAPSPSKVVKPTVSKISKLKLASKKAKQIKCTWKKMSGAGGYELQYSDNKKYKKAKTLTLGKKKISKTITGLTTGKKYYVRIRAYKTYTDESGEKQKVFGKWVAKNIKCK